MKQYRQFLLFGALFLAVSLLYNGIFGALIQVLPAADTVQTAAAEHPVIILDAGHGGEDGGASGANGVPEKDLNLSLTRALAALLRLHGYTVVESRTEDKLLYDAGTKKGHKKQSDLNNRLALTRQYPNCVFISIHMNTFPDTTCRGLQVWYSPNDPASLEWADAVRAAVTAQLQPENHRKSKAATSSIYILRHAQAPAILIECGFLSTPEECAMLCDAQYQRELALSFFSAIAQKIAAEP